MSSKPISSMTEDEFANLIRASVRAEFAAIGLRLDEPEDQDEAREDMRLIRKLRRGFNGASAKLGGAIILALVSGLLWLMYLGFHAVMGKAP